jgi:hypothetical protein
MRQHAQHNNFFQVAIRHDAVVIAAYQKMAMQSRRSWLELDGLSFSSYAKRITPLMEGLSAVRQGESRIAEVDLGGAIIEGFDIDELLHTPGEANTQQ